MDRKPHIEARVLQGAQRRLEILDAAIDASTAFGLEGLSIGQLAEEVGLSKGGVAGHFPSKVALQLATVEHAAQGYVAQVLRATEEAEPGIVRLREMMIAWLDFIDHAPYRAGCFFAAAGAAVAGREGPVRDLVASSTRSLIRALEREALIASKTGEIAVEPRRLTFSLHALVQEANLRKHLLDDADAFSDARALVEQLLLDATRTNSQPA